MTSFLIDYNNPDSFEREIFKISTIFKNRHAKDASGEKVNYFWRLPAPMRNAVPFENIQHAFAETQCFSSSCANDLTKFPKVTS